MAVSRSASLNTMLGDLPPSSSETFFRLPAAAWTISLPTSVDPVKATLSTSGCAAKAAPAVSPYPGTMLTTPSGKPASANSSPRRKAESGVCSAGLSTTVQPDASAGPSFHAAISSGKFHGMICADHADRLAERVGEIFCARRVGHGDRNRGALDLRRPSRHVAEQVDGERNVGGARHGQRLAVVERFDERELVQMRFEQIGKLPDQASAFGSGHARPWSRECFASGFHGELDILSIAFGDVGEHLAGGWIVGGESLA